MQCTKPNTDTARSPCDKSEKVQALIEYIESLRQSLSPDKTYHLTNSHSLDESRSKNHTQKNESFLAVYQALQNLEIDFNTNTQTVDIRFLSETDILFQAQWADIDSKEFCFVFMVFLAEWTSVVMTAMQYFNPNGWCKVPFWKVLKEIRNRAFDIFAYPPPRQTSNTIQKQIPFGFEQFSNTVYQLEKTYSELYCEEYIKNKGENTLVKKIGKVHGVLDAFEVSILSQNHFRFHFDYGQTPSDIGPVSINDQAFWYAILNFYAYLYYKARSLQADAPPSIVEKVKVEIRTLFITIVNLYYFNVH